jgi:hypothetical protein
VRKISGRVSVILTGVSLRSSVNLQANSGPVLQVKALSLPYTVFANLYLPVMVILTAGRLLSYWQRSLNKK